MPAEHYRTAAGSRVEISGVHRGISMIDWDWFEEGACRGARPAADVSDRADPMLCWYCDCCQPGQARLYSDVPG